MHIAQLKIELGKKEEAREHVLAAMDLCRIRIGVNDQSFGIYFQQICTGNSDNFFMIKNATDQIF